MTFNKILQDLISEKSIDIKELSAQTKIETSTLYGYLNSNSIPNLESAINLSNFFDVSIDYLLGLTDINNPPSNNNINFIKTYETLLKTNNVSNYKISKELGIGRNRIYDWKRGTLPKISTLISLSKYFAVSIESLLGRND